MHILYNSIPLIHEFHDIITFLIVLNMCARINYIIENKCAYTAQSNCKLNLNTKYKVVYSINTFETKLTDIVYSFLKSTLIKVITFTKRKC